MTASPIRFPLADAASHNRKRRSFLRFRRSTLLSSPQDQQAAMTMDISSAFGTMMLKNEASESLTVPTSSTSSLETCISSSSSDQQDEPHEAQEPKIVFRSTLWLDGASSDEDDDDASECRWTLKRASPVLESDDDFCQYESPTKRTKTYNLNWSNRLSSGQVPILLNLEEDDDGQP